MDQNKKKENESFSKRFEKVMDTKDETGKYEKKDIDEGKGMSALSYIIPLIPYFAEKKNNYVRFHARQGMDLLIICLIYTVIYNILTSVIRVNGSCGSWFGIELGNYCRITPWWVLLPLNLIWLILGIIGIIGIINAINGRAKELPIVYRFKILK